jgi:hypothetical protein
MAAESRARATSVRRPRGRPRGERFAREAQRDERGSLQPAQRDREHLQARLENLRTVVPVFAQELAVARRQAAALRLENRRLLERISELQRRRRTGSR